MTDTAPPQDHSDDVMQGKCSAGGTCRDPEWCYSMQMCNKKAEGAASAPQDPPLPALACRWQHQETGHIVIWEAGSVQPLPRAAFGPTVELCSRTDALRLVAELRAEIAKLNREANEPFGHLALRAHIGAAERRLAELERAQEHKVYCQCAAHAGQMWPVWKTTATVPARTVCPNCEATAAPPAPGTKG